MTNAMQLLCDARKTLADRLERHVMVGPPRNAGDDDTWPDSWYVTLRKLLADMATLDEACATLGLFEYANS